MRTPPALGLLSFLGLCLFISPACRTPEPAGAGLKHIELETNVMYPSLAAKTLQNEITLCVVLGEPPKWSEQAHDYVSSGTFYAESDLTSIAPLALIESQFAEALRSWYAPLKDLAVDVPSIVRIAYSHRGECSDIFLKNTLEKKSDATIYFSKQPEFQARPAASPPQVFLPLSAFGIKREVILHEFGHLMGLGDAYNMNGSCQIGQPTSVMCGMPVVLDNPTNDDRNGILALFCGAFPDRHDAFCKNVKPQGPQLNVDAGGNPGIDLGFRVTCVADHVPPMRIDSLVAGTTAASSGAKTGQWITKVAGEAIQTCDDWIFVTRHLFSAQVSIEIATEPPDDQGFGAEGGTTHGRGGAGSGSGSPAILAPGTVSDSGS